MGTPLARFVVGDRTVDLLTLALFVVGANLLVRGASGLAAAVGVSPLVVGLIAVALGPSLPEQAVDRSTERSVP